MAETRGRKQGAGTPRNLDVAMKSVTRTERGLSLVIRLRNSSDRALHYVGEVRGLKYDPATKVLTVLLSDEGRALVPGPIEREPRTHSIDPASEAELSLELPRTIVKLTDTPSPPDRVTFEEHTIAEAQEIHVKIAWSDMPYYPDPRPTEDDRTAIQRWQRDTAVLVHRTDAEPAR